MTDLTDPLPTGPFDLVASALAIHHLEGPDRADLFARIAGVLRPGGRFALGDVVIPVDPADAVTPVDPADAVTPVTSDQRPPLPAGRPAGLAGRRRVRHRHELVRARSGRRAGRAGRLT